MKQRIALLLVLMMLVTSVGLAFPMSTGDMTALDKMNNLEKYYFGSKQTGSLLERSNKLEKDIFGSTSTDPLMLKVDRAYSYTGEPSLAVPSFVIKLNAVEWNLSHSLTGGSAKSRLENMEKMLIGSPTAGSFDSRLSQLLKLTYIDGQVEIAQSTLNKDTLIKIRLLTPLDSKTSRPGDVFRFAAEEDLYSGGTLVIAKGAIGQGKVAEVEEAKNFGRDAKLTLSYDLIQAMDGTDVPVILGEKAKQQTLSMAKAAGATVAGVAILGPVGLLGGAFVQGENVKMPVGTLLYVQVKNDIQVYGLKTK